MYGQPVVPDGAGRAAVRPCSSGGPTSARPNSSWSRANAQVGVAKAEFFPKLSLTGMLGTASPEMSAITSGSALDVGRRRAD